LKIRLIAKFVFFGYDKNMKGFLGFLIVFLIIGFLALFHAPISHADWFVRGTTCVENPSDVSPTENRYVSKDKCVEAAKNPQTPGSAGEETSDYSYKINDLDVYSNPDQLAEMYKHPETRIDGNTHSVWVTFTGLSTDKEYYICGADNLKSCYKGNSVKTKPNSQGEIIMNVCGNGKDALKGEVVDAYNSTNGTGAKLGEKCKDTRDYFHEGQTYHLTVYDYFLDADLKKEIDRGIPFVDISVGNIITADFFVAHSYPLTRVTSSNALSSPINVTLWGRRPGDGNDNNYQAVLEGTDHQYKEERCYQLPGNTKTPDNLTVGINTQWVADEGYPPQPEHIFDGVGYSVPKRPEDLGQTKIFGFNGKKDGPVGRGTYVLKINERVSDNRPLNFAETCEGGHSYMQIFFRISDNKNATNGVEIVKVVYDPDNADGKDIDDTADIPPIPCAEGSLDKATGTCSAFNVALLGKIPLNPLSFIKTIYTLVLSIAGVAAVLIIIRAGYKFMYSRGNKEIIADARSQLTSAIIGLAFIIFAYVILSIIGVDILKIPGFG
jgi:hypothetical protein